MEHSFPDCRHINPLRFDFYLKDHNALIETDGMQHFLACSFGGSSVLSKLDVEQVKDGIKTNYTRLKSYSLLRIAWSERLNMKTHIETFLKACSSGQRIESFIGIEYSRNIGPSVVHMLNPSHPSIVNEDVDIDDTGVESKVDTSKERKDQNINDGRENNTYTGVNKTDTKSDDDTDDLDVECQEKDVMNRGGGEMKEDDEKEEGSKSKEKKRQPSSKGRPINNSVNSRSRIPQSQVGFHGRRTILDGEDEEDLSTSSLQSLLKFHSRPVGFSLMRSSGKGTVRLRKR